MQLFVAAQIHNITGGALADPSWMTVHTLGNVSAHAARPLRRANTEAVVRGGGRSRARSGAPGSPGGSGRGSLPPAPLSRSASNPGSARLSHSRSNSGAGLDALRGQRSATPPTPSRPTAASIV